MSQGTCRAARLLAGALLCAAGLGAQASAQEAYSLVTARETQFRPLSPFQCFWSRDASRVLCPGHSSVWYDEARSLAGPPVDAEFGAGTEVGTSGGYYRPVLIVLSWRLGPVPVVIAQATADESGRACIARDRFDRLSWHPAAPGIAEGDGAVCADLAPLAALPAPDIETVMTANELPRQRRRSRTRRGR